MAKPPASPEDALFHRVVDILEAARGRVTRSVNTAMVQAYWLIGSEIVQVQQRGARRAGYGDRVMATTTEPENTRYYKDIPNSVSSADGIGAIRDSLGSAERIGAIQDSAGTACQFGFTAASLDAACRIVWRRLPAPSRLDALPAQMTNSIEGEHV